MGLCAGRCKKRGRLILLPLRIAAGVMDNLTAPLTQDGDKGSRDVLHRRNWRTRIRRWLVGQSCRIRRYEARRQCTSERREAPLVVFWVRASIASKKYVGRRRALLWGTENVGHRNDKMVAYIKTRTMALQKLFQSGVRRHRRPQFTIFGRCWGLGTT